VNGDPALRRELVHLLLQDYPGHLTTLREALRRGEADPVIRTTHALQGAMRPSDTLAATLISALARMDGAGALEDASCVLPPLERELAGITTFYTNHKWAGTPECQWPPPDVPDRKPHRSPLASHSVAYLGGCDEATG
jgi:hypothetical protein